jgi:hypothetical protein
MMAAGTYETLKAELEKRGVPVSSRGGQNRCMYVRDRDGHRLQLIGRA